MEAYIGNMLLQSVVSTNHLHNLHNIFNHFLQYEVKLNLLKCAFELNTGKLVGHLKTTRGIEANLYKIRAIRDMNAPKKNLDIQRLTWCLATLERFSLDTLTNANHSFKLKKVTSMGQQL